MAVIVPLPTRARTGSALQKSKSNIVKAHRKNVVEQKVIILAITELHYFNVTARKVTTTGSTFKS